MRNHIHYNHKPFWFAYVWVLGLCCGTMLARKTLGELAIKSVDLYIGQASVLGVLSVNVVPFVICSLARKYRLWFVLYLEAAVLSFMSGFNRCFILCVCPGAGWLVCILLFTACTISNIILLLYSLDSFERRTGQGVVVCLCILGIVFACVADYYFISPLATDVLYLIL